jgi:hypothetical protein
MRVTLYLAGPEVEAVGPYDELDRREVEATDDMTVSSVLAAGEGPEEEMLVYSFFVPLSEANRTGVALDDPAVLQAALNLFGVDEEGHIIMTGTSGPEVTWGQFVRAAEAGLIDGDPSQLIVFGGRGPAGGGGFEGWLGAAEWAFDNRDAIVAELTNLGVILASAEAVRRALLVLPRARRHALAQQWAKNGITPQDLERIVKRRPRWDPERLGPYLALTPTETVALLGELGYGKRADGLYQLSPDPELRARRHWWQINAKSSRMLGEVYEPDPEPEPEPLEGAEESGSGGPGRPALVEQHRDQSVSNPSESGGSAGEE